MRECKEALKLAVAERQKYISRVKVGSSKNRVRSKKSNNKNDEEYQ